MTSYIHLPPILRHHPAIKNTELSCYATGSKIILPPNDEVLEAVEALYDRLGKQEDDVGMVVDLMRHQVLRSIRAGAMGVPVRTSGREDKSAEEAISHLIGLPGQRKKAPPALTLPVSLPPPATSDKPALRPTRGLHEVLLPPSPRTRTRIRTQIRIRPKVPVSDIKLFPGTDMYLCKSLGKFYHKDPKVNEELLRRFDGSLSFSTEFEGFSDISEDSSSSSGSSDPGSYGSSGSGSSGSRSSGETYSSDDDRS